MTKLADMNCTRLRGAGARLTEQDVAAQLEELSEWKLSSDGRSISRAASCATFMTAVRLTNDIATLAEAQDHHPDISIRYRTLELTLSTHDSGGLTLNDMIMAAKIDLLIAATS